MYTRQHDDIDPDEGKQTDASKVEQDASDVDEWVDASKGENNSANDKPAQILASVLDATPPPSTEEEWVDVPLEKDSAPNGQAERILDSALDAMPVPNNPPLHAFVTDEKENHTPPAPIELNVSNSNTDPDLFSNEEPSDKKQEFKTALSSTILVHKTPELEEIKAAQILAELQNAKWLTIRRAIQWTIMLAASTADSVQFKDGMAYITGKVLGMFENSTVFTWAVSILYLIQNCAVTQEYTNSSVDQFIALLKGIKPPGWEKLSACREKIVLILSLLTNAYALFSDLIANAYYLKIAGINDDGICYLLGTLCALS